MKIRTKLPTLEVLDMKHNSPKVGELERNSLDDCLFYQEYWFYQRKVTSLAISVHQCFIRLLVTYI